MTLSSRLMAIFVGVFLSFAAMAQEPGFYVGGSIGYSNLDAGGDEAELEAALLGEGVTATVDIDDTDMGWNIFGGYNFNQYFGAEIGYVDLGEASADIAVTVPAIVGGSADVGLTGVTLHAVASYPVYEQIDLFAKAGAIFWDADLDVSVAGVDVLSDSDDGTDFTFGLGAKYNFSNNVTVRAEWNRYMDVGDSDIDLFSVGVLYNFNLF